MNIDQPHSTSKGRKALDQQLRQITKQLGARPIVLVGMMGSGKTTLGRRLAKMLKLDFHDSDHEVELAAGMTIPDIFSAFGEAYFRQGEAKVIARLVKDGQQILSLGGGAFINDDTRALVNQGAVSVWLQAPADVLMTRLRRKQNRPLMLTDNPEDTLRTLIEARQPLYAQAMVHVDLQDYAVERAAREIIGAIHAHIVKEKQ